MPIVNNEKNLRICLLINPQFLKDHRSFCITIFPLPNNGCNEDEILCLHLDKIDSSTSNLCYRFRLCVVTQEDSVDAFPRMRKKETRDISDIIEHRMKVLNITGTRKLRRIQSKGGGVVQSYGLIVRVRAICKRTSDILTTTAKVVLRFKERRVCYNLCDCGIQMNCFLCCFGWKLFFLANFYTVGASYQGFHNY